MKAPGALWLALGEAQADLSRPLAWLARDNDPAWGALTGGVKPSALDLADAALFSSPDRSAGRLARRLLLKALVGRVLGVHPEAVVIERSPVGAIAVTAPRPLGASLSARGGWTMAGLWTAPIGVDIEAVDPALPLPLDVLHPGEAGRLAAIGEGRRAEAFARHWAVKEAALKACGAGLNLDPAGLEARFEGDVAEVVEDGCDRAFAEAEIRPGGPGFAVVAILA